MSTKCRYCGSTSYGSGCIHSPTRKHRHGSGGNKCIWCGSTSNGSGCIHSPTGKFGAGMNGLSRLFGKELTVLLWAVENVPKNAAPTALRNWKSLMPEERWWLYTQTAAAPRGWKKALGYALAERAAQSYVQGEMF